MSDDGDKAIICGANVQALKLPSARGTAPPGEVPMMVLTRPADGHILGEILRKSNHDINNPADLAFLSVLKNAQKNVHIMTPNLNDDDAKNAILEAAKRGVKIEIVIPKHFNDKTENKPGQGGTNVENIKQLLAALPADKRKNLEIKYFNGIEEGRWADLDRRQLEPRHPRAGITRARRTCWSTAGKSPRSGRARSSGRRSGAATRPAEKGVLLLHRRPLVQPPEHRLVPEH